MPVPVVLRSHQRIWAVFLFCFLSSLATGTVEEAHNKCQLAESAQLYI